MVRTYDPAKILCSFLGAPVIGFADGTFVTVERAEDSFSLMVGAGGETARARSHNKSGTVTFTLMASSPTNDLLAAAVNVDEKLGTGVGPVFIKEAGGLTLCLGENAWIKKIPNVEFGKEVGTREWVIQCASLEMFPGSTPAA